VRLSNSQDVSLIQRVLMTLVLRLLMNSGFSFNSANRVFRVLPGFMGKTLVIAVKSSTKRNNKTRSCTWAKRIYIWRLLSCCRAPLNANSLNTHQSPPTVICAPRPCADVVSLCLALTRYSFILLTLLFPSQIIAVFCSPPLYCPHYCNIIAWPMCNVRFPSTPPLV